MSETKEALTTAVLELINLGVTGLKEGVSFLKGEIPDVVEQLLMWYGIESFLYFCIGFIIIIVTTVALAYLHKSYKKALVDNPHTVFDHSPWVIGYVFIPSFYILALVFFMANLEWLKIWVAPKVWLIDYTHTLIK